MAGRRRPAVRAALLGLVLLAAACGEDGGGNRGAAAVATPTTSAGGGPDDARFCDLLASLDGEVDESYLGSPEHLADLDRLAAAAPDAVRGDVELFRRHVRTSVSPEQPGSADMAGYPEPVTLAIDRIRDHRTERC